MKPKALIASPVHEEVVAYLEPYCEVEQFEGTRKELLERIGEFDGLMQFGLQIDQELLERATNLKVVSNISVGYNNFDLECMKKKGIIGTNTAGTLDETVADLVLGLMLATARRIPELDCLVKRRQWTASQNTELYGIDVHGARLGIIGLGRIGEAVAKRARFGFDMEVCYYNRNPKPEAEQRLGISYIPFLELLETSDFIVLLTPYTEETRHLIDFKEFSVMKKTAIFINASRGQTVNELALIDALENGKIYGAGLDVYEQEPLDPDNPLIKLPNAVTLPHIGSATDQTRRAMALFAAKNLAAALTGQTPESVVPELR